MREPRPNHDPRSKPPRLLEERRSFPELLQLLYSERYTGSVTLKFRGGQPHVLIRRGLVTLLLR